MGAEGVADKPAKKTKRRIVKNPETFRERAVKAAEEADKPSSRGKLRRAGGRVMAPVARPVGKAAGTFAKQKPVKVIRKPLRWIGLVIFPVYFRRSWQELKQVKWPTWRESFRLTFAVLVFAFVFGAVVAVVDFGLDKLFRNILLK